MRGIYLILLLLIIFWIFGFAFRVAGGLIHILLVVVVLIFITLILFEERRY